MDDLPSEGQRVRITVQSLEGPVEHIGTVLPYTHDGHITLKLDNGYNANYSKDGVQAWEILD
ncbi:MAG: hypothetical protein VW518_03850, partial [Burkholderiaceae bacterium]